MTIDETLSCLNAAPPSLRQDLNDTYQTAKWQWAGAGVPLRSAIAAAFATLELHIIQVGGLHVLGR